MLKRALNRIWSLDKQNAVSIMEYENWPRQKLVERIKELERCNEAEENELGPQKDEDVMPPKKKTKKKDFNFHKHSTRFIALKFAYLGWNYNGLSFQYEPTPLPTVEEEILKAMELSKLIEKVDPTCCNFSRCGRTDKGVSAMNQVISLNVRSNLKPEEQALRENDKKEIPYVAILNSLLPSDIRVTAMSLRPPEGFDARFSCKYRHYNYFFKSDGLDIEIMKQAAKKYEGHHDYRNFCKIDGSKQITNFKRMILSSNIVHLHNDLYMFDLKGTAFLWHQVRCMMAVLLMVGQKLESTSLIDNLLDVEKYPSKPSYEMANDIPLILYDCAYENIEWMHVSDVFASNKSKLFRDYADFNAIVVDHQIRTTVVETMESFFIKDSDQVKLPEGCGAVNTGDGRGRNFRKYVPVLSREMGESFEHANARYKKKKERKTKAAT